MWPAYCLPSYYGVDLSKESLDTDLPPQNKFFLKIHDGIYDSKTAVQRNDMDLDNAAFYLGLNAPPGPVENTSNRFEDHREYGDPSATIITDCRYEEYCDDEDLCPFNNTDDSCDEYWVLWCNGCRTEPRKPRR